MSKLGKKLIEAFKEGVGIARGEIESGRIHYGAGDVKKLRI